MHEGLQILQATTGAGLAEIQDGLDETQESLTGTATGLSESKEHVDARVPEVRESFGKQSDASDKDHGDIKDMRYAGGGSEESPSTGAIRGMVPHASQKQEAVEYMGDSTRFIEMDQTFDVTCSFRQGVGGAASSPPTQATRGVGHQAFGSTDAAEIPRETPAHGTGFA